MLPVQLTHLTLACCCLPEGHVLHFFPSGLICMEPQFTHSLWSVAAYLPGVHRAHVPAVVPVAWYGGHESHPVLAVFGCVPFAHVPLQLPLPAGCVYLPGGQLLQSVESSFGCLPFGHRVHLILPLVVAT